MKQILCPRFAMGPYFPAFVLLACAVANPSRAQLVVDAFDYADSSAAQTAWSPQTGVAEVTMAEGGDWGAERAMLLPCDFSADVTRSYWEREVALDLSSYTNLGLDFYVADPSAIDRLTVYFRSGAGWYSTTQRVSESGWHTLQAATHELSQEGTPTGLDQIDRIRLSPWKGATSQDTYLALRQLSAWTPQLLVVADTTTADTKTVETASQRVVQWLGQFDIEVGIVQDSQVTDAILGSTRLIILPFNPSPTEPLLTSLESYVGSGGKLMVMYSLNARIAALLGITRTGWTQGDFTSYTMADSAIAPLPARVYQGSWNITIASPTSQHNARQIAAWHDSSNNEMGYAAWLASDNGLFHSHILLNDDASTKQAMLLALVGHFVPEVWPAAARASLDNIGRIADYGDYTTATADIQARAATTTRTDQVAAQLDLAEQQRLAAVAADGAGRYADAVVAAAVAREHLLQAYYLCQLPVEPEFRAVWEHAGLGAYAGDWDASIDVLRQNGFDAVFTNMLRGGSAHFNSSLLPHSEAYDTLGDQITQCVDAAHAQGIEVHVWKVNWNLSQAPQDFIDTMRAADRTQVTVQGEPADWLCPSHPDNQILERDSMLEVVANYDVDGIHFDYIRYPGSDYCYCDGCRARFQDQTGNTIVTWPDDVLSGALQTEFLNWRRSHITHLVDAVYTGTKALKPYVQVSAAVFRNASSAYDGVGQDWVDWIDRGIVDFLCPMDYTDSHQDFRATIAEQKQLAAGRIPIFPGIGVSAARSQLGPDGTIVQIEATRAENMGGFILFNFNRALAEETLPPLGLGITAPIGDAGVDAGDAGEADASAGLDVAVPDVEEIADSAQPDIVGTAVDGGTTDGGVPDGVTTDGDVYQDALGGADTFVLADATRTMDATAAEVDSGTGDLGRPDASGKEIEEGCGCSAQGSQGMSSLGFLALFFLSVCGRRLSHRSASSSKGEPHC